jgi:hypothetical protein
LGVATVKRAYGNWTTRDLATWKPLCDSQSIHPVQQFKSVPGKNSCDGAMIIDAMDLLHSGKVDGFCLVSSDSDFTRLATRIREEGLKIYGFGQRTTPRAFVNACTRFICVEDLREGDFLSRVEDGGKLREWLTAAIVAVAEPDGWASAGKIGFHFRTNHPSFDTRAYGCTKLGRLLDRLEFIEKTWRQQGPQKHLFVRLSQKGDK